jgi:hypothetical protein
MNTLLRKGTFIPVAALLLGAIAAQPASAQGPDLDRVMSAQEREATGIARLKASERAALEAWLSRYTATVSATVQGMAHPSGVPVNAPRSAPTLPRVQEQPRTQEHAPRPSYETLHPRTIAGAKLFRSTGGGTFVMLEDGTMWEIYLPHRPESATWQEGDFVRVRNDSSPIGDYEHVLVSGPGSSRVSARFAGFVKVGEVQGAK